MAIKDRDKRNAYNREWKRKNREKVNLWERTRRRKNKEKWREYHRTYRLLNNARLKKQSHRYPIVCEVCSKTFKAHRKTQRFCSRICMGKLWERPHRSSTGKLSYRTSWRPNHPNAVHSKVKEHRIVMEKHLGRLLLRTEVVHHINGNSKDNRLCNLMLFPNNSAHIKYHRWHEKQT